MTADRPGTSLGAILDARFSCRAYQDRQVPRADIETVLARAQRTPSWCNSQPWTVYVTEGESTARLSGALLEAVTAGRMSSDIPGPEEYRGVYNDRRRASGFALYETLGIDRADKGGRAAQMLENYRFFGAPHTAIVTTEKALGTYGAVDCGAYVSTFMYAATEMGIATIAQAAVAMVSPAVHEFFDIPDDRQVVCAISFGYADEAAPINTFRTDRARIGDVATFV